MHPLWDNLKNISFEELEKRKQEIHKRMQLMRRAQNSNPQIWDQLELMLDAIMSEQQDRFNSQSGNLKPQVDSGTVMVTDPLEDDLLPKNTSEISRTFKPVQ
jgi:hypothetical protein